MLKNYGKIVELLRISGLILCGLVTGAASASGQLTLTFSAASDEDTVITLTGSGSVMTNANGVDWSTSATNSFIDDSSGNFSFLDPTISFQNLALTGSLTLSATAQPDIVFTQLHLDHDGSGDDLGLAPVSITPVAANTLYSLSGSAVFTLASQSFGNFVKGTHGTSLVSNFHNGFSNFNQGDLDVVVALAAVPEPSSVALGVGGLALLLTVALRRRKNTTEAGY